VRNKFYASTPINAVRKVANEEIPLTVSEGSVISVGKNDVRVQVKGSGNSQPAYIGKGLTIEASDRVLLVKSPRTSQWIVIGAYVNPQSSGNTSAGASTNALAPSGLTIIPLVGGFLARCTVGVDTPAVLSSSKWLTIPLKLARSICWLQAVSCLTLTAADQTGAGQVELTPSGIRAAGPIGRRLYQTSAAEAQPPAT
jgi:hypothetical protein